MWKFSIRNSVVKSGSAEPGPLKHRSQADYRLRGGWVSLDIHRVPFFERSSKLSFTLASAFGLQFPGRLQTVPRGNIDPKERDIMSPTCHCRFHDVFGRFHLGGFSPTIPALVRGNPPPLSHFVTCLHLFYAGQEPASGTFTLFRGASPPLASNRSNG